MANNIVHRTAPSIPLGRPSQNLGHIFNSQLNQHTNLPISIFSSNPLSMNQPTLNKGLQNAKIRTANAQAQGGARGLLEQLATRVYHVFRIGPPVTTLKPTQNVTGTPTVVKPPIG